MIRRCSRWLPGLLLALGLTSAAAAAQQPQQSPPGAEPDFARFVFPPELVMQNQQRIGLRPEQRTAITEAIRQFQASVVDLQWKMQEETQRMSELLQAPQVNEAETLAQADRVMGIEREVKRAHLALLIRIKNTLTREQQATLRSLR